MPGKKEVLEFFLLLAPALVLALYSYVGLNSRLMADDFCTFLDARRFKLLRFIWHWYNNWGGRYSAIATDELLVSIGAAGVRFVPFVVLAIWAVISSLMCYYVLTRSVSKGTAALSPILLGVLIVFTTIVVSPGFDLVLFWWNGMRTYIPPLVSFSFHIAYLYWATNRLHTKKLLYPGIAVSFLIAVFGGGYNETFTLVQSLFFTGLVGLMVLAKRFRGKDASFHLLSAAALGSVFALVIMLSSPGAAQRRDIFTSAPLDVPAILEITVIGYLNYGSGIFGAWEKVSVLLALILVCIWMGMRSETTFHNGWLALLAIAGGVLLSFASLLPSAYGLGKMPAFRTYSVPTFILVISTGYGFLIFGTWLAGRTGGWPVKNLGRGLLVCILISIFYSAWLNGKALYDHRDTYIEYARLWDDVDSMIKQAKKNGDESITIPSMAGWAGLDQPNENPKYWATRCYSEFYGIQVYGPPYGKP